jgi:hypothetical protein
VGQGASVIEAAWAGFVDLRRAPQRVAEIAEAAAFPPLAELLLALNADDSPVWTAKCDFWEAEDVESTGIVPESAADRCLQALACYVDVLPAEERVFAQWHQAEALCRDWVARLNAVAAPRCRINLVVRQALVGEAEGFAVTAYIAGAGGDRAQATEALAAAMAAFSEVIPGGATPAHDASQIQ